MPAQNRIIFLLIFLGYTLFLQKGPLGSCMLVLTHNFPWLYLKAACLVSPGTVKQTLPISVYFPNKLVTENISCSLMRILQSFINNPLNLLVMVGLSRVCAHTKYIAEGEAIQVDTMNCIIFLYFFLSFLLSTPCT